MSPDKFETIVGGNWSSKAAAGDAQDRVNHDNPFIALWIGIDGHVRWSKANTDFKSLAQFQSFVQELAAGCIRGSID